jgi:hypothetical protein
MAVIKIWGGKRLAIRRRPYCISLPMSTSIGKARWFDEVWRGYLDLARKHLNEKTIKLDCKQLEKCVDDPVDFCAECERLKNKCRAVAIQDTPLGKYLEDNS